MRNFLLVLILLATCSLAQAQQRVFIPVCGGVNDTARFTALISVIGSNSGTIRLPWKNGTRCAVNTLTIPNNVTLDNTDGTGIRVNSGQVLTVVGPVVSPIGKQMFFGPGTTVFTGNTHIGANSQVRTSDGVGGESWTTVSGGGGGGAVNTVFGRAGDVIAVTNDYTWAQINKGVSSIADITLRSADLLSNGTTGTGQIVLRDSPTFTGTPVLGTANATSINGIGIAGVGGKTLTVNNSLTLIGSSDGFSFVVPASGTAVLTSRTITEGAGLAGNTYDLSANRTLALGTPSTLSVSSLTSVSGTTHSHAIASSANPGAAASILASDGNGYLQLTRLGLGITPSQPLEVNGNVLISASTANLFLKDTSTGFQSTSSTVVTPQANNAIRSTAFTSGLVGWNISATGSAEFDNVDVRGAIHASIFTYNAINATAGTLGVFKSAAKLRTDVTVPASPTYGTTTVSIDVVDADGLVHASSQLFVVNDILRLKDGLVGDTWFKVTAASDQTTFWRYTAAIMAGTNNVSYRAGMGVPDYGQTGQGFIILTADQTNSPYLQMATHTATFSSSDSSGSLVFTPRQRTGNLNGSYGYATDVYGFGTGQYGVAGQSWVTVDPTNGVRIGNNTTPKIQLNPDGSGQLANSSITWNTAGVLNVTNNATIAGWTINPTNISNGTTYLASNFDIPSGQVAWFGKATDRQGWNLRDSSGRSIFSSVGLLSIYPHLGVYDGAHYRVILGGLNSAWESDGSTNSMGMKIWNSAGTKLVEFSDVQNIISGWTIGAAKISSTGIDINSGASAGLAFGTTPPTSASAGTGIWLDRTGLYGLASNVVQAKVDATTGAITAAAGSVLIDVNGIRINQSGSSFLQWQNSGVTFAGLTGQNFATGNGLLLLNVNAISSGKSGQIAALAANFNSLSVAHLQLDNSSTLATLSFFTAGGTPSPLGMLIGGDAVNAAMPASTILEVRSTTGSVLFPRMTTTQKNALTPLEGMVVMDITLHKLQVYDGSAWVNLN